MLRAAEPGTTKPVGAESLQPSITGKDGDGFPGLDQPFSIDERPPGITFYRSKESFFLPYHLLQGIRFNEAGIKLIYATADVVLCGRGLHQLYVRLAAHQVSRIVEQGERYDTVSNLPVHITRLQEIPKER